MDLQAWAPGASGALVCWLGNLGGCLSLWASVSPSVKWGCGGLWARAGARVPRCQRHAVCVLKVGTGARLRPEGGLSQILRDRLLASSPLSESWASSSRSWGSESFPREKGNWLDHQSARTGPDPQRCPPTAALPTAVTPCTGFSGRDLRCPAGRWEDGRWWAELPELLRDPVGLWSGRSCGRESGVRLALGPPPESHSPPGSSSVSRPLGRSSVVTEEGSVSRLWGDRATRGHGVGSQASPPSREAPLQAMAGPGPWPERPSPPSPHPARP